MHTAVRPLLSAGEQQARLAVELADGPCRPGVAIWLSLLWHHRDHIPGHVKVRSRHTADTLSRHLENWLRIGLV